MEKYETHLRTCNICEAMCGIEVRHEGGKIVSIKPDKEDPFSHGHICPKAIALQDFYQDPDRLKKPLRKTGDGWQEISWDQAFAEISEKVQQIQTRHGKNSVGVYLGNPNAHNLGNAIFLSHFLRALGSINRFSSASADQMPHHVAASRMFGATMAIAVPDIDRTDFMLIIGGNPVVSNGSMMSGAGMPGRLKGIQKRGGQVVVVDPRRTETAKIASEHLFIVPETDALLLLALIRTVIEENLARFRDLEPLLDGYEQLVAATAEFTPEGVSSFVGIAAHKIRQLARDFASAPSAVCYSRMGASTQTFGGLCQWLTVVLNIITGNFDRAGGAMFPQPAFDLLKPDRVHTHKPLLSRVRQLPHFHGEFPICTLAEEITTAGEGQIKALFTIAGNPVLSAPNGDRLDHAFEQLDFMVSVDIYLNETTRHADIILPATTGLETSHYDVFFNGFAVRNTAKYAPPLFEKEPDQKHDWQILKAMATCLTGVPDDGQTPEHVLDAALKASAYGAQGLSLQKLIDTPHGVDLGPLQACAGERIKTPDGRIRLAPNYYLNDLPRLRTSMQAGAVTSAEFPLRMIGRRLVHNHNTWTHNSHRLIKGDNLVTLQIHSADAERLHIKSGQMVTVRSKIGQVSLPAEVDDDILPGVVSIPQGWGHHRPDTRMRIAKHQPGISINSLTDDYRIDQLTGNAAFNGTPVAVQPDKV